MSTLNRTISMPTDSATVEELLARLDQVDSPEQHRIRRALIAHGEESLPALLGLLTDAHVALRWGAAKTLAEMKRPVTIPALIRALDDSSSGVRWVAAEGLVALGHEVLSPLLSALIEHSESVHLRWGIHHVLKHLAEEGGYGVLYPVVSALEGYEPDLAAPVAAQRVLVQLG